VLLKKKRRKREKEKKRKKRETITSFIVLTCFTKRRKGSNEIIGCL
jgi:hypothetical protein